MQEDKQAIQVHWGSLSLRLSAFLVVVLVAAAFAVSYLYDRGRAKVVRQRELEHLRIHAERGADELERIVRRLRGDVLFLANTPPVQGVLRAWKADGFDRVGTSDVTEWEERLQQIFLSIAEAKPEYLQIHLIGVGDNGRELVRVERTAHGPRATVADRLKQKGEPSYLREASRLEPGGVYLSRINLNREHAEMGIPQLTTLRAATPVQDLSGSPLGVVVVSMDMGHVLDHVVSLHDPGGSIYVADERGNFLLHPQRDRAFTSEPGSPYRLEEAFPGSKERIARALSGAEAFVELPGPRGEVAAFVTERAWDPRHPERRLIFILTEPAEQTFPTDRAYRRAGFLITAGLVALAIVLLVFAVRRVTRSLSVLAAASQAIGAGDYEVALPAGNGSEVAGLMQAFRCMATELERRETALGAQNRQLKERVEKGTAELMREHSLKEIILESIADGIVVADRDGRFLVWNDKAEQLVGAGADDVLPEHWSSHFGLYRDEAGGPVPTDELPLVRAIGGEPSDNVELFVRNPQREEGRWVQVTARPLLDKIGEIAGGVAVLVDVTEQKHLRRRVESDRAELAKFARLALSAGIASSSAHRLSQPIAAMSNYASAAVRLHKQHRLGEAQLLDILTRIENHATQAGESLDELRALIRQRDQPAISLDVNRVANSCLHFLRDRIERLGVEVDCRYGRGLPRLQGDPIELVHVLIQLVTNALDALGNVERTERRLSVGTSHNQETGAVLIEVADSGPGVSPKLAEHLFDPLPTHDPDALGMGLYIARTIVDAYNGLIHAGNGALGGAVFCVELPVVRKVTV